MSKFFRRNGFIFIIVGRAGIHMPQLTAKNMPVEAVHHYERRAFLIRMNVKGANPKKWA